MPTLYIMCGLAFSGKSTLARKIAEHTGSKIIAFDKLWVEKAKEQPVPQGAEGWKFIREVGQNEVEEALKGGASVVYDDNNVRFEHRGELREVARRFKARAIVVYLNTPLEIIRERVAINKTTGQRHEVEPKNFNTVLEQLQIPTDQENVMQFTPEMNLDEWVQENFKNND